MNIVEIILLIVAWLLTLTWMYGVRVKPVIVTTSLVNLSMLLVVLFFTLTDFSKYHLLWAMPFTMFIGVRIFLITAHIPILNIIIITLGNIYTEILRIGIGKDARNRLQQEYKSDIKSIINEWSSKK